MKILFFSVTLLFSTLLLAEKVMLDNCYIDVSTVDKDDQTEKNTHSFFKKTKKECLLESESYKINFAPSLIKSRVVKVRFDEKKRKFNTN